MTLTGGSCEPGACATAVCALADTALAKEPATATIATVLAASRNLPLKLLPARLRESIVAVAHDCPVAPIASPLKTIPNSPASLFLEVADGWRENINECLNTIRLR
jgi:hypothetical protein